MSNAPALQTEPGFNFFNAEALKAGTVFDDPFRHFTASGVLTPEAAGQIRADFPQTSSVGFLSSQDLSREGAYAKLLDDLESEEMAAILSEKLDINLVGRARMITVRRWSRTGDGRAHTDSEFEIATFLTYLNESWKPEEGGAIRALRNGTDMNDYAREIAPVQGHVFGFRRAGNSWHGHPPFAGERLVVQLTYLQSAEAADRKRRNAGVQGLFKKLFERVS